MIFILSARFSIVSISNPCCARMWLRPGLVPLLKMGKYLRATTVEGDDLKSGEEGM